MPLQGDARQGNETVSLNLLFFAYAAFLLSSDFFSTLFATSCVQSVHKHQTSAIFGMLAPLSL